MDVPFIEQVKIQYAELGFLFLCSKVAALPTMQARCLHHH
jgi:hypothetical protein